MTRATNHHQTTLPSGWRASGLSHRHSLGFDVDDGKPQCGARLAHVMRAKSIGAHKQGKDSQRDSVYRSAGPFHQGSSIGSRDKSRSPLGRGAAAHPGRGGCVRGSLTKPNHQRQENTIYTLGLPSLSLAWLDAGNQGGNSLGWPWRTRSSGRFLPRRNLA
jgi:hypothetical protein